MKPTKVQCPHCKDIVFSSYSGEFVSCSCGLTYIDETEFYLRTTADAIRVEEKENYD